MRPRPTPPNPDSGPRLVHASGALTRTSSGREFVITVERRLEVAQHDEGQDTVVVPLASIVSCRVGIECLDRLPGVTVRSRELHEAIKIYPTDQRAFVDLVETLDEFIPNVYQLPKAPSPVECDYCGGPSTTGIDLLHGTVTRDVEPEFVGVPLVRADASGLHEERGEIRFQRCGICSEVSRLRSVPGTSGFDALVAVVLLFTTVTAFLGLLQEHGWPPTPGALVAAIVAGVLGGLLLAWWITGVWRRGRAKAAAQRLLRGIPAPAEETMTSEGKTNPLALLHPKLRQLIREGWSLLLYLRAELDEERFRSLDPDRRG